MDLALKDKRALVVGPDDALSAACVALFREEGAAVVESVAEGPDIVVAHGVRGERSVLDCDRPEQLEAMWDAVESTVATFREALGAMHERGFGRLIWIGSAASRSLDSDSDQLDALATLSMRAVQKVIRAESGPFGVTANAVIVGGDATAEDAAAAAVFLASSGAGYLTGITITVDGGAGSAVY
jgi:NAD(P)-dependent dehydrogenase (short-subunit alcohol dehydrogenase family)